MYHRDSNRLNRPHNAAKPLVLIIDDNEDDRFMMSRMLERAGFRITETGAGEEAVAAVRRYRPQVVLLDLLMPGKGGLTTCRLLRAQPATERLPIVILSGLSDAGTIRRAFDAGATEFAAKPDAGATLEGYAALAERLHCLLRGQAVSATDQAEA
ncbi:response regulator [Thiogranum longum]